MGKKTAQKQQAPQDVVSVLAAKMPKGTVLPTKEWLERFNHDATSPTNASGQKVGRATLREPWFESLVKRDWKDAHAEKRPPVFTVENLQALRIYRNQFEAANRSEMRSCLNVSNGGRSSGGGRAEPTLSVMAAKRWLGMVEPAVGAIIDTLRAVAIDDKAYQVVAMERFGSRAADFFDKDTGSFTVRFVPKSGRHPMRIKDEFVDAVRRLTGAVTGQRAPANSNGAAPEELPVEGVKVSDQLAAKLSERRDAACPVTSIVMAAPTWAAICRELGTDPDGFETAAINGVPVSIHEEWKWGWVLNGEVGE